MLDGILYALSALLSIVVFGYIIFEYVLKKWKCVEGTCEKIIGGDYSHKSDCQKKCIKIVSHQLSPSKSNKYSCEYDDNSNTNRCVESLSGKFDILSDCQNNCVTPTQIKYDPVYTSPIYYGHLPRRYYGGRRWFNPIRRRHRRRDRHRIKY